MVLLLTWTLKSTVMGYVFSIKEFLYCLMRCNSILTVYYVIEILPIPSDCLYPSSKFCFIQFIILSLPIFPTVPSASLAIKNIGADTNATHGNLIFLHTSGKGC